MNTNVLIFSIIVLVLVLIYMQRRESFWGGYFPVPYMGQYVKQYGRTGYIASTDDPKMIIDLDNYNIN